MNRKTKELIQRYKILEGQYDLLVNIPGIGPGIARSEPLPKQSSQHKNPNQVRQWRRQRLKSLLGNRYIRPSRMILGFGPIISESGERQTLAKRAEYSHLQAALSGLCSY